MGVVGSIVVCPIVGWVVVGPVSVHWGKNYMAPYGINTRIVDPPLHDYDPRLRCVET